MKHLLLALLLAGACNDPGLPGVRPLPDAGADQGTAPADAAQVPKDANAAPDAHVVPCDAAAKVDLRDDDDEDSRDHDRDGRRKHRDSK